MRIDDKNSSYFKQEKGLDKGLLSPLLFSLLVTDVFTKTLEKEATAGFIKGMMTDLIPQWAVSLQYVEDTIVIVEDDIEYAKNLKRVMCCIEQLSQGGKLTFTEVIY